MSDDTPYMKIKKSKKCRFNLFDYVNKKLNIVILGMAQPQKDDIFYCINTLAENNVKFYITLNEINRKEETALEKYAFSVHCDKQDCEFWSLPILDYTAPTVSELHQLWGILDRFHLYRSTDNKVNALIHCTGGTGRTALMLISYIWLKLYNSRKKEFKSLYKMLKEDFSKPKPYRQGFELLMDNPLITFTKRDIGNTYSDDAVREIFNEFPEDDNPDPKDLCCKRFLNIINACYSFKTFDNPPLRRNLSKSIWISPSRPLSKRTRSKSQSSNAPKSSSIKISSSSKKSESKPRLKSRSGSTNSKSRSGSS